MKTIKLGVIILSIFCVLLSCSEVGLQGPEGVQGEQGAAGEAGPAGQDGSIIYSGTGIPIATLGKNGDYYLNRSTGDLYGPKVGTGWSLNLSLKGANGINGTNGTNGTNGKDGNKILSAEQAPTVAIGVIGDYYLDRSTFQLYGPKTSTGWGLPILLRGAQGAVGPMGPSGKDGSIMYAGAGVPPIGTGQNGDYYLNKTNADLYGPKSSTGWGLPLTLRGTNGINGSNGTDGLDGSKILSGEGIPNNNLGKNGDYYLDRINYRLYGPKTVDFGWGVSILLRGADGAQGPQGPAGADGTIIYSGTSAPDTSLGKVGDLYYEKTNLLFYGPKTNSGWGVGLSLKGSNGTNGTNGLNGNSILNGQASPNPSLGNIGDFYLNYLSFEIYGPKTASGWGNPTSLKGTSGSNETIALETADATTLSWYYESSERYNLKKITGTSNSDSSSVFQIPANYVTAASKGVVLVYLGVAGANVGELTWYQLNYTDLRSDGKVTYQYHLKTGTSTASLRILSYQEFNTIFPLFQVKKVRIVISPPGSTGLISRDSGGRKQVLPTGNIIHFEGLRFQKI